MWNKPSNLSGRTSLGKWGLKRNYGGEVGNRCGKRM